MSKGVLAILFITIAVVFFIIGGGISVFYQSSGGTANPLACQGTAKMASAIKSLSSGVIPSVIAYGQVTDINGRSITLVAGGASLTVNVKDQAKISKITLGGAAKASAPEAASFSDIKKGDSVNISLKVTADGTMEGESVYVLAQPAAITK